MVSRLKSEDLSYGRLSKAIYIIYFTFIPVFLVVAVFEFIATKDMNVIFWASFSSIAFAIFALLFRSYMKEYNYVDYAKPTIEMLQAAADRYKPFPLKAIWALVAVVFIDLGMIFHFAGRFDIIQTQQIFIPVLLVAIVMGYIFWIFKYKPLRDNALRLINELKE